MGLNVQRGPRVVNSARMLHIGEPSPLDARSATPRRMPDVNAPATPSASEPVIVLDHVAKHFANFVAVHEADFTIRRGEFFSMLGPSGCGKTTTLRMIAGFEQPTSGRIMLEGEDVSKTPPYRRNVNTVFQHYALFPHMSVFDNVAFGPRCKKLAESEITTRVQELLKVVRLDKFSARKPGQLSGGQQQRVALARALVNYPSALLLDEPLGALDLKLRQAMQIELKRIQREVGITFIYVTHDQEEALTMSDRIAVMNEGRVEQIGPPEEIYHSPRTVFVANFIGQANLMPAKVIGVMDGRAVITVCGDHRLEAPVSGWEPKPGTQATLMIRPERVRVVALNGDSRPVPALLEAAVFQGPAIRAILRAADGSELTGHVGPEAGGPSLVVGQRYGVTWEGDAARLLPPARTPNQLDMNLRSTLDLATDPSVRPVAP